MAGPFTKAPIKAEPCDGGSRDRLIIEQTIKEATALPLRFPDTQTDGKHLKRHLTRDCMTYQCILN